MGGERLLNKVAVVTGAARGMGFATAKALAAESAKVLVTDVDEAGIDSAVAELRQDNEQVTGRRLDVTRLAEVREMVRAVIQEWGGIDILVNNAGGALNTPHRLQEIEEKHWDLVVNVNLKGTFFCCQAVIPEMADRSGGSIINMSALAAHWRASLAGVQYTAAKAGVEGLTRQLAYDWGPYGVRVNAVAPTVTITGERVKALWEGKDPSEQERILSQIPLRRLSRPEEIAAVIVFLASDESCYITGTCVDVNGGRYLR